MKRYVIIGSGVAGVTAAEELRRRDADAKITIFNNEPFPNYFRAALAFYIKDIVSEEELFGKPPEWAVDNHIHLVNDKVHVIKIGEKEIVTEKGYVEPYDALLIATGASAFKPPVNGASLDGVMTYRTLVCVNRTLDFIRKRRAKTAVLVGGGILGIEMAENLHSLGLDVTVLERGSRIVELLFDETGSSIVKSEMERDGVTVMTSVETDEITGENGIVTGVTLKSGETIPADLVIFAIGVRPVTTILENTLIKVDRGLVVDERMKTNVDGVYGAGDVTLRHENGEMKPCRTWLTAARQGITAAINMTGGDEKFTEIFFNASHVYKSFYAIVGKFNSAEGDGVSHLVLPCCEGGYSKLVFENKKLVGGQFIGAIRHAWQVYHALEQNLDIDPATLSIPEGEELIKGLPALPNHII